MPRLEDAPDAVRIEAFAMHVRGPGSAELLRAVPVDPTVLIGDPTKDLRSFRIAQSSSAGTKRGTGRGAFIDSLLAAIDDFYEQVIQNLKLWMPAPPQLRSPDKPKPVEPVPANLVSTAISSQDGPRPTTPATVEPSTENLPALHTDSTDPDSHATQTQDEQGRPTVAT